MRKILPLVAILATACTYAGNNFDETKRLFETKTSLTANAVKESPAPQFNQIETDIGIFYATTDNQFIFTGTLHQFDDNLTNLTDMRVSELNKEKLSSIEDSLIIYPAKNEKYRVVVFSDHSCGYCNKLHKEMQSYNDLGISIAYAAFPRAGYESLVGQQMISAWCAKDKQTAINLLHKGKEIPYENCPNKINYMHTVGKQFGIQGTPSLILPNGKMTPGYYPAHELLELLEKQG